MKPNLRDENTNLILISSFLYTIRRANQSNSFCLSNRVFIRIACNQKRG